MTPRARLRCAGKFVSLSAFACTWAVARAQDTRTVTEPVFPPVCTVLGAQQAVVNGEPATETNLDTSTIQSALNACPQGQGVELAANGSNNAFLMGPITIPGGVTLIVDGGVTVFGSRNPADYQISGSGIDTCGTVGSNGNGCNPLITVGAASTTTSGAALMGYGVVNGRGGDKLLVNGVAGTESWWDLANDARSGGSQNNPILVQLYKANNSVLYKLTLINSPHFHVKNNYGNNWTVWGAKIITPWTSRNTDGIDPTGNTNVTITNSVIGDGDDEIAISGSTAASNYTFSNLLLPSGHGVSIGSTTSKGVSNVLAENLAFSGQAADTNQEALHIKTAKDRGGLVQNITYKNVCIQNVRYPIQLDAFYDTTAGTLYPQFSNITYANVHVLTAGNVELSGYSAAYQSAVNFDNVVFDGAITYSPVSQYATVTFTNAISGTPSPQVYPASLTTIPGVTYANSATVSNANAYNCTNAFPALVGELYASTSVANNLSSAVITSAGTVTLNAVVEPTNSQQSYTYTYSGKTYVYTGVPAPTGSVQFLENGNVVGTGTLGANGTLASATISNALPGTHTYTAKFVGDSNYAATPFGSVTVNVTGAATQAVITSNNSQSIAYGTAPGTVTVALEDASGNVTGATTPVTLAVTNSGSGYSQSYTATPVNGVASFYLSSSLPGVGSYNAVASSPGVTSASATETVTPAILTVAAQPVSRPFDAPNPALTFALTGFVNGDTSAVVSGTPLLSTTAVRNSPAGSYPIAVANGSLTAANYTLADTASNLTVTGGVPQVIFFHALPNFPSGGSYQLVSTSSSGLPNSYSVTGPATVTGTTLTVTGPGTVTVTAANAGNASYGAATSVSQTFTAQ